MDKQEAIDILEQMGLGKDYRCPSCNEILINKLRRKKTRDGKITYYSCSSCNQPFRMIRCKICKKNTYAHLLNVCIACFKEAKLTRLAAIKSQIDRDYKKLILVKSRRKPDISFSITKYKYNKIVLKAIDEKCSKADLIKRMIDKSLS